MICFLSGECYAYYIEVEVSKKDNASWITPLRYITGRPPERRWVPEEELDKELVETIKILGLLYELEYPKEVFVSGAMYWKDIDEKILKAILYKSCCFYEGDFVTINRGTIAVGACPDDLEEFIKAKTTLLKPGTIETSKSIEECFFDHYQRIIEKVGKLYTRFPLLIDELKKIVRDSKRREKDIIFPKNLKLVKTSLAFAGICESLEHLPVYAPPYYAIKYYRELLDLIYDISDEFKDLQHFFEVCYILAKTLQKIHTEEGKAGIQTVKNLIDLIKNAPSGKKLKTLLALIAVI